MRVNSYPIGDDVIIRQLSKYPAIGPEGISHIASAISDLPGHYIDCLVYRIDGKVVGALNYFHEDLPGAVAGSCNILVLAQYRRRGIATALLQEAERRWTVRRHRLTPVGRKFIRAYLKKKVAATADPA